MCGAGVRSPHADQPLTVAEIDRQRSAWSQWSIADLTAAAAEKGWSQGALMNLLSAVGARVGATRGAIWLPGVEVHWAAEAPIAGDPRSHVECGECRTEERLLEFCGTTGGGASVMMLWESTMAAADAEDIVDDAGRLLVDAWERAEECTGDGVPREHCDLRLVVRAAALRMRVGDVLMRHQAAGMLAQRFDVSIADADRRVRATAERFQLSVSGCAEHLLGHAQVGS